MKPLLFLLLLLASSTVGHAQKNESVYRLPANIQKSEYSQASVLVKWKTAKKQNARGRSGLSVPGVTILGTKALAPAQLAQKNASWRGPVTSQSRIDIGLYERIALLPGQDIETVINRLYASGNFEFVEPEFAHKMSFTPNDPRRAEQYYLDLINAYEAWDVTKGSESVVIAIVDSGGDLDHPDLAANIYSNPDEIAGNGIDDDNDGYVDNKNGWDFVGADTLNIFKSDFIGDNDPNLKQTGDPGVLTHGVWVAGCASAKADNGVGIAGVGFNSKLLFTKHTADNQDPESLSVFFGYDGILYAANTLTADNISRKIINCSWGGSFRSQIAQDIITYVTLDLGCLVIGAAGNENSQAPHFPSGYDYVLSVAATNESDVKASFSNTGYTVDLCAPGVSILSTRYNNVYSSVQGTSFSCPIVSGAAALLWAHKPELTALQVSEQIRVSADVSIYSKNTAGQADKLGRGRLDIQKALAYNGPSVRASNPLLKNIDGGSPVLGASSILSLDFTNYLSSTSGGLSVTLSSTSPFVTFSEPQKTIGFLNTNQTIGKTFPLTLAQNTPENQQVNIKISIQDGAYSDFQVISFAANPSFLDIDENQITTSISSRGRIGFDDPDNQEKGNGFVFNEDPVLFEMGLLMGTSANQISNNIRGIEGKFDQDFSPLDAIRKIVPGEKTNSEVYGSFINGSTPAASTLQISYRSFVRKEAPYDKFIILEYKIKNISTTDMNDFRFGLFADWDISGNGAQDASAWNAEKKIAYIFPKVSNDLPHAGIQVLNRSANHYAIDNNQAISGNPFGVYDGFTDSEKFTSLSTPRNEAGTTTPEGNDVSHVVSATPVTIGANEEVTIAFALHAANNLDELLTSAAHADTLYNTIFPLAKPVVSVAPVCYSQPANLTATGTGTIKWYSSFTGGEPIASGSALLTANLFNDSTFYAADAFETYESVRTAVPIQVKANPLVRSSGATTLCEGNTITLTASPAAEYLWSNGATTQSIDVSSEDAFSVTVKEPSLGCESTSEIISTTILPLPTALFESSSSFIENDPITFTDKSTGAASWFWDFGDDETSAEQNPTHTYVDAGQFNVQLTVFTEDGCSDTHTETLDVITGLEYQSLFPVSVYPNPALQNVTVQASVTHTSSRLELLNAQGARLRAHTLPVLNGSVDYTLSIANLPSGVYILKIWDGETFCIKRIVKEK